MALTLVTVGQATLAEPAASAYRRALAAGAPDSVTSSYRSPERQAAMRADYELELAAWRAGRRKTKPTFVARVEDSEHVTGNAIDLRGEAAKAWFRAWGADYGWLFTDDSEDWHIAYRATNDKHRNDTQEDDMPTAAEVAAAVWAHPLGPLANLPANPAWVHLLDVRLRVAAIQNAKPTASPVDLDDDAIAAAIADTLDDKLAAKVADLLAARLKA